MSKGNYKLQKHNYLQAIREAKHNSTIGREDVTNLYNLYKKYKIAKYNYRGGNDDPPGNTDINNTMEYRLDKLLELSGKGSALINGVHVVRMGYNGINGINVISPNRSLEKTPIKNKSFTDAWTKNRAYVWIMEEQNKFNIHTLRNGGTITGSLAKSIGRDNGSVKLERPWIDFMDDHGKPNDIQSQWINRMINKQVSLPWNSDGDNHISVDTYILEPSTLMLVVPPIGLGNNVSPVFDQLTQPDFGFVSLIWGDIESLVVKYRYHYKPGLPN